MAARIRLPFPTGARFQRRTRASASSAMLRGDIAALCEAGGDHGAISAWMVGPGQQGPCSARGEKSLDRLRRAPLVMTGPGAMVIDPDKTLKTDD